MHCLDFGPMFVNDLVMVAAAALVVFCAAQTYRFIELPGQRLARSIARDFEARPAVER